MRKAVLLSLLVWGAVVLAVAGLHEKRVLRVPGDYPGIQAAIDAAPARAMVRVASGTYEESIDFRGKALALVGEARGAPVKLVSRTPAPAVTFQHGEGWRARIEGFVIEAARGVLCRGSSPTIKSNRLVGRGRRGVAIECLDGARPVIVKNVITGFTGQGGIRVVDASPTLRWNIVRGNRADRGGGVCLVRSAATVIGNVIGENESRVGGGVYVEGGSPRFASNLIVRNRATSGGGFDGRNATVSLVNDTIAANRAAGLRFEAGAATLTNAIVWGNRAAAGAGIEVARARLAVAFSDIEGGWPGAGNLDANPCFVDPEAGDFHLVHASPCRGRGAGRAAFLGDRDFEGDWRLAGGRVDLGADQFCPRLDRIEKGGGRFLRILGAPGTRVVVAFSDWQVEILRPGALRDSLHLGPPVRLARELRVPSSGHLLLPVVRPREWPAGRPMYAQALIGRSHLTAVVEVSRGGGGP